MDLAMPRGPIIMNMKQFILTEKETSIALQPRDCNHCGSCCRSFCLELTNEDVAREPQLLTYATAWGNIDPVRQNEFDCPWVLFTESAPCPFLDDLCLCRIYKTRPDVCRRMIPSILNCHCSRIEETGVHVAEFIMRSHALSMTEFDPNLLMGLILAVDHTKIEPIGIARGIFTKEISLLDILDEDYFRTFRKQHLTK
jgi:Fe-S-cluster containining protein